MYFGARAYTLDDSEFLAQAGFQFAEIEWKDPAFIKSQLPQLAMLQHKFAINYLAHGPNEGDPFDLDNLTNLLSPLVCQLLDLAPELGIALYTQHLWLDPRFIDIEFITRKLALLELWVEHAAHIGITLCIENLSEHAAHLASAFERMPGLGLTLDLGHAQILSQPNAAFGFIQRFPDRIRHVHLHDNFGGTGVKDDLHLPIGEGHVDFSGILKELRGAGYAGGFSFEIKLQYVERGRDAIRQIWSDTQNRFADP